MTRKEAMTVAGMAGGKAIDSGGGVWIVEVRNPELGTVLCLGGIDSLEWWIEDEGGEHIFDDGMIEHVEG